jgi:hypothetical protein
MSTDQRFPFWPFIGISVLLFCVPLTLLVASHNPKPPKPAVPCIFTIPPATAHPHPVPQLT